MSEMSDYLENVLLNHVLGATAYTAAATLHLALSTATIIDATTGTTITEQVGNNYSRKAVTNNATNFPAASGASKSLNVAQTFPTPSGSWGTVTDIAVIDAASVGNIITYTPLTASKVVNSGNTVDVAIGALTIAFNSTNISTYLAHKLLDLVFSQAAFTPPVTVFMALCTAAPTSASTGTTITEPSGNNYSRLSITNNTTNFPNASGGSKSNGAAFTFAVPSGTWGACTHYALCDAATLGNVLFFGALGATETPGNGDTVRFAASAYTYSFL